MSKIAYGLEIAKHPALREGQEAGRYHRRTESGQLKVEELPAK
jgi:hypothetical protein